MLFTGIHSILWPGASHTDWNVVFSSHCLWFQERRQDSERLSLGWPLAWFPARKETTTSFPSTSSEWPHLPIPLTAEIDAIHSTRFKHHNGDHNGPKHNALNVG